MDVGDLPCAQVVVTVIFGDHHGVEHRPQGIAVDPQQDLRLGQPRFHIEMVAMQGDTAITVSGAGKQGPGKLAGEFVGRKQAAFGLT